MRRILIVVGGVVGLLLLAALATVLFVDVNRFKPRLEAAASDALGMNVRLGRLGIGLFPTPHLSVEDARILDEQGASVGSTRKVRLWVALLPLLGREFRLRRVELTQPSLSAVRDAEGRSSVEPLKKAVGLLGVLDGSSLSFSDGTLLYADARSGEGFEATDIDLAVSRVRFAGGESAHELVKRLSLEGRLTCREIRMKGFSVSALKISIAGRNGIFRIEPITMDIFGGRATAGIQADISGAVPSLQLRYSLPRFRIEEFLKTLSPDRSAEGVMDFSASLSMQGQSIGQMVQTAAGTLSLRGEDLLLQGNDLDGTLSRFESSQNFNLVDVGAVFLAGPLGLTVTKGYNFASLFKGSGGSSRIRALVSDWRVERGVAKAHDVAMATVENRIALRGGLDFVTGRFADVTVAVIDAKGCARVKQTIHGPFAKPVVEKPHVLTSLAGPVLKLYQRTRRLLPAGPCEAFYSGSVAAPR